jgi:hypothetical protein
MESCGGTAMLTDDNIRAMTERVVVAAEFYGADVGRYRRQIEDGVYRVLKQWYISIAHRALQEYRDLDPCFKALMDHMKVCPGPPLLFVNKCPRCEKEIAL